MGTVIQKTSGSCMGDFGDLRSQSSAGFLGVGQRGISVWGVLTQSGVTWPAHKQQHTYPKIGTSSDQYISLRIYDSIEVASACDLKTTEMTAKRSRLD